MIPFGDAAGSNAAHTTFPATLNARGMAYGNGTFVAIGAANGRMAYSLNNGDTWTTRRNTAQFPDTKMAAIRGIIYGGPVGFIVVGMNGNASDNPPSFNMSYSSDGIAWTGVNTSSFFGTSFVYSIVYGGGKYIAGGADGKMASSVDGITWTAIDTDIFEGLNVFGIGYGNGVFVAGASNGGIDGAVATGIGAKIAYSTDGETWLEINMEYLSDDVMDVRSIAWGDGKFIAVGAAVGAPAPAGRIIASIDGITWFDVPYYHTGFTTPFMRAITYGGGRFMMGAGSGQIVYSDLQE